MSASFGLVHGSWHSPRTWDLLAPELEARGHRAIAVDLPAPDPDAGLEAYADAILGAVADEEDVVLVGHSLGGVSTAVAAARRPVSHVVYLCGLLPKPGMSLNDDERMLVEGVDLGVVRNDDGTTSVSPERAREVFYHDCPPAVADVAVSQLRRQTRRQGTDPCPLEALPDGERTYVLCRGDRCVDPAWSRRAAQEWLGVEAVELEGGHSPMLSRPAELADLLCRLA